MKKIFLCFAAAILAAVNVYGEEKDSILVRGSGVVTKSNPVYNINPFDPAKIDGVGNEGVLTALSSNGKINLDIGGPLMKINDAYSDYICLKDGRWGVMRNVGKMVFDGSEDWRIMDNYRYKNDKTFIFSVPIDEKIIVENGMCTYFDVISDKEQKTYVYDAVSVGSDNKSINMRFMNVRGVNSTDSLKAWLKGKNDAGNPVVFYYALTTPVFEPFSEAENEALKKTDLDSVRFSDINIEYGGENADKNIQEYFIGNGRGFIGEFIKNVREVKVYGGSKDMGLYIESYKGKDRSLEINLKDADGDIFRGEAVYENIDFMSKKTSEITFESKTDKAVVKMQVYFYNLKLPMASGGGYSYKETGLAEKCYASSELILPDKIWALEGEQVTLYMDNAMMNKTGEESETVKAVGEPAEADRNKITFNAEEDFDMPILFGSGEKYNIAVSTVKEGVMEKPVKVMLLGDSLINEEKYPKYLKEMMGDDIELTGTRGADGMKHEGRGGWAVYDYCNTDSKYGFTNPFLNEGKFDFSYYMDKQGFDGLDYVVINLGINDLNLIGHNGTDEILGSFDKVIKSIWDYNGSIQIIINTPIMLFDTGETVTAKNARLEFIRELNLKYGEKDGIYIAPVYLMLDPYLDFKLKEPVIDDENQDGSLIVTDTTHPADSGYEKIAKSTCDTIKYAESVK